MVNRPLSVTVLSWVFIAFGAIVGGAQCLEVLQNALAGRAVPSQAVAISLINVFALIGGIFVLRGSDWARRILLGWLVFHVIVSVYHTPFQFGAHLFFLCLGGYILFGPAASRYFQRERQSGPAQASEMPD